MDRKSDSGLGRTKRNEKVTHVAGGQRCARGVQGQKRPFPKANGGRRNDHSHDRI